MRLYFASINGDSVISTSAECVFLDDCERYVTTQEMEVPLARRELFSVEKSQIGVPSLDGSFGLTEREALETLRAAVIREYGRKDYRVDNITNMINYSDTLRYFDAMVKDSHVPAEERLEALSSAICDMLKDSLAHKNVARYCDGESARAMAFADVFGTSHGSMLSEREWAGRAQGAEYIIRSFLAKMGFAPQD